MKTNGRFLLTAIFGLALAFTFISCANNGDENNGGENGGGSGNKVVTFSLDKIDSKSFKLTVNGARWNVVSSTYLYHIFDYYCNVTYTDGHSEWLNGWFLDLPFDYVQNGPNVITFTMRDYYTNVTGTVSLDDDELDTYGGHITDGSVWGGYDYKANPTKSSITF